MSYCAPGHKGDSISCFSKASLIKMAQALNKTAIKGRIRVSGNKQTIWEGIRRRLSDRCTNEICWVDQQFARNINHPEINIKTFRPKMPTAWKTAPRTWLTTDDINLVMQQYERQYPTFLFIGPVPSDCPNGFACELSTFNPVKLLKSGKNKVGIIYNLDKHNQPGSHWVAVYIDMDKHKDITYYDSYGHLPPNRINNFMKNVQTKLNKSSVRKMKLKHNRRRHQYGGSECGMYSMNYLIERLKGKSLQQAVSKKISDKTMEQMRTYLYRPA